MSTSAVRSLEDPGLRRTLRFVIGVTATMAYAYYVDWQYNFLAVVFVAGLLLAPIPAPSLRLAATFLFKFYLALLAGLALILPLQHLPAFGIAIIGLIIFLFYYADALGKVAPADSALMLIGAVLVPTMSGASIDASISFAKGFAKAGLIVFPAAWMAYAILPEKLIDRLPTLPALPGDAVDRALYALTPVIVVLPIVLFLLSSDHTARYLVMAMKAAQVIEQRSAERGRAFVFDVNFATFVGSAAGVAMWWLLKLWPSLLWYVLLTVLFTLFFGWRVTRGPGGMNPRAYRWSYAYMTLVIVIGPDLLKDDFTGDDPETRFYLRVFQFIAATAIASAFLYLLEGLRERRRRKRKATVPA